MLHIEIKKDATMFDAELTCTWNNTVAKTKDNKGTFKAPDYNQATVILKRIIIAQAAKTIHSIAAERRFVYKTWWKPDTMHMLQLQQTYIDRCDKVDRVAKAITSQSISIVTESILQLCAGTLRELIPAPGKKNHEKIKEKVEQIKTFFSDKLGCIEPELLEKTSKIEL